MKKIAITALLISLHLCINAQEEIKFISPGLYPEGVTYSPRTKLFYVSSVITGTISTVDEKGNIKPFYTDKTLKSTFGMKVDNKQSKLWICSSDPNYSHYSDATTFKKMARLVAVDLSTGQKTTDIDLAKLYPAEHFANDLSFDNAGNIYITDSYAGVIYKVDKSNKASVFADDPRFKGIDVGLNGIVYHPGSYLLVADGRAGAVWKVDVKNPKNVTRVTLKSFFPGADGMLLDKDNSLLLIQNKGVNKMFRLVSGDDWKSAEIVAATKEEERFQNPTTLTMRDGNLFILNSKMNELQDSTMGLSKDFSLQQADLTDIK